MSTQTSVRSPRPHAATVMTTDRINNDPSRHPPDWGVGLGIHRQGDLHLTSRYPADTEVVHIGPFLRWLDDLIRREGQQAAMLHLGWGKNQERRARRWRFENTHPWVRARDIEDALDHADLRLADVYPETDVGEVFTTWCPTCRDSVIVDTTLVCPWCDGHTELQDELPAAA